MHISDWSSDVCSSDLDHPAVIADRADETVEAGGGEKGEAAAPAISDDGDLIAPAGVTDRRLDVAQDRLERDALPQVAALGDGFRIVAQLDIARDAGEGGRRPRVIAAARLIVCAATAMAFEADALCEGRRGGEG